ncbi:MAG: M20 metallopeptidase family protein [Actinomycetota bacterium]
MDLLELAKRHAPAMVDLRRALHRAPELGLHLPDTQARVLEALDGLPLEVTTGTGLSSVVAVLRGGAGGPGSPVVLLRGDMDALPVTEEVDVDYRSEREGLMHACGHDLHVAGLVGAARILCDLREELAGDVVFMFQPGEEGPGGAAPMIEEGLLEAAGRPVDAAYAVHVTSSEHPLGQWFARPGAMMSAVDRAVVTMRGAGGHGSQPHRALDPVPALCEVVLALQTMVTRTFDAFDSVVLTVGRISAGTADNIIPDTAELAATLRTFSPETRDTAVAAIERVAHGVAAAHGLTAEVSFSESYPATVNDDAEYALAVEAVGDLFGPERFTLMPNPEMGSEDMSFVMQQVPGAYLFVSACGAEDYEHAPDNHSPRAAFDDSVVPDAAALLAEVARRRLARG